LKYLSLAVHGWPLVGTSICDTSATFSQLKYFVFCDSRDVYLAKSCESQLQKCSKLRQWHTPCFPKLSYAHPKVPTANEPPVEDPFECISTFPNYNEAKDCFQSVSTRQLLRELNTSNRRYLLWGMFFVEEPHKEILKKLAQQEI